jgi:hypothetical protein
MAVSFEKANESVQQKREEQAKSYAKHQQKILFALEEHIDQELMLGIWTIIVDNINGVEQADSDTLSKLGEVYGACGWQIRYDTNHANQARWTFSKKEEPAT